MKKEVVKREMGIGDTFTIANKTFLERFDQSAKLRSEAHVILGTCAAIDRSVWDDMIKEYSLPNYLQYKLERPSGAIIVAGYDYPKGE